MAPAAPWVRLVGVSAERLSSAGTTGGFRVNLLVPHPLNAIPAQLPARGIPGALPSLDGNSASISGPPALLTNEEIPALALRAYQQAVIQTVSDEPGCHLPWALLAAIGRVESDHGRAGGGLTANGTTARPVLGPLLDGSSPGTARLLDTDGGQLDGSATFDRAVGPMQFVPGTWQLVGRDGNRDGIADPNNIRDASSTAATFLCANRDLSGSKQQRQAVFAYNPSQDYVNTVMAWSAAYAGGVTPDTSSPVPASSGVAVSLVGGQQSAADPGTSSTDSANLVAPSPRPAARAQTPPGAAGHAPGTHATATTPPLMTSQPSTQARSNGASGVGPTGAPNPGRTNTATDSCSAWTQIEQWLAHPAVTPGESGTVRFSGDLPGKGAHAVTLSLLNASGTAIVRLEQVQSAGTPVNFAVDGSALTGLSGGSSWRLTARPTAGGATCTCTAAAGAYGSQSFATPSTALLRERVRSLVSEGHQTLLLPTLGSTDSDASAAQLQKFKTTLASLDEPRVIVQRLDSLVDRLSSGA